MNATAPSHQFGQSLHYFKRGALQIYRIAVLVAIAWIVRDHYVRLRVDGAVPLELKELRTAYPDGTELRPDPGERGGMWVFDNNGKNLGYVLRTSPIGDSIIGYRGWTDSFIAFDPAFKVIGVGIHASQDTREHVEDIQTDRTFLKTWNGKSWDEVAGTTPEEAGIEGVSGATMTSMAMAEAITSRLRAADSALAVRPPPLRWRPVDIGLTLVIFAACVLAITGTYGRKWLRHSFHILVILYVGFLAGAPLAQSLIVGWTQAGVPWRTAPGLVLLLAASLAVPWATGNPLYCQQICPHGAAQELLHRIAPKRWRVALPKDFAAGLRWLPGLLLAFVLVVTMLTLPIDLAHIEPFDAYVLKSAGFATIAIGVCGLVASLFIPMAYCHYGCPTGAMLNFIRSHGRADRFNKADLFALFLLGFGVLLSRKYKVIHDWILAG